MKLTITKGLNFTFFCFLCCRLIDHKFISGLSILFHRYMCLVLEFHFLFLLPSSDGGIHEEEKGKEMSVRGQVNQATDRSSSRDPENFPHLSIWKGKKQLDHRLEMFEFSLLL